MTAVCRIGLFFVSGAEKLEREEIRRENGNIDKKENLYHPHTPSKCPVEHRQPACILVLGQETTTSSSGGWESQQCKGLKETATKIENAVVNITPQTSQVCLSYNKGVKIKRICVLDYPHERCGCKMHCGNHLSIQELSTAAPIRRLWYILKPSQMCSKNLPLQVTALKVMSKKSQGWLEHIASNRNI